MGRSDTAHHCAAQPLVAALMPADLERAAAAMDRAGRAQLLKSLALKPGAARDTTALSRLGAARLRSLPAMAAHNVAVAITTSLSPGLLQAMGGQGSLPSDSAAIEAAVAAMPGLVEQWSPALARLVVVSLWEASGLDDDDRDRLLAAIEAAGGAAVAGGAPRDADLLRDADLPRGADPSSGAQGPITEGAATPTGSTGGRAAGDPRRDVGGLARGERVATHDLAGPVLAAEGYRLRALDHIVLDAVRCCRSTGSPAGVAAARDLVTVDPLCPTGWFLVGFAAPDHAPADPASANPTAAASADPAVTAPDADAGAGAVDDAGLEPPTAELAGLRALGVVAASVERGERALAVLSQATVRAVLGRPSTGLLAAEVLAGTAAIHPTVAAELLDALAEPVPGWAHGLAAVRAAAQSLLDRGEKSPAERLLRAGDAALDRWASSPAALSDADRLRLEAESVALTLARAGVRRRRHDLAGARALLDSIEHGLVSQDVRAQLALEHAFVAADLPGADALVLPASAGEARGIARRLHRARPHLAAALELSAGHAIAGVLAVCESDHAGAVEHLDEALTGLDTDLTPDLVAAMRFHRAVARLCLLEPGTDAAAVAEIEEAVAAGHRPGADHLVLAAEALAAHGSDHHPALVALAAVKAPTSDAVAELVASAARQGHPAVLDAAQHVASQDGRSLATRFDLLEGALEGAAAAGDVDHAAQLAETADDIVARASDAGLDCRWERLLATNDPLRTALEPAHADAARIEAMRRAGRIDEARALGRALFFRAAGHGAAGFDPGDLLGLLAELGEPPDALDELIPLARGAEPEPVPEAGSRDRPPGPPVRVLFVGGNETQARYQADLDDSLAERHGGCVTVEWYFSGWGSGWAELAEQVEAAYERADVVVLLTLMRTTLGRRLRRSAGEAGLAWFACTGHGRASIERAIDRAASHARGASRTDAARSG